MKQFIKGCPVKLAGIGHYFPGKPINNEYFSDLYNLEPSWIVDHTGIESRNWPDTKVETFVQMAEKASLKAMKEAKISPDEIDLLICTSSTTRASANPSTLDNKYMDVAPPLQPMIGARNAMVFDISAVACLGFVSISTVAQALMTTMNLKTALTVCVENPKPILNFQYKNSALFGAGAVATVWKKHTGESDILDAVIHSDGSYFRAFDIDKDNNILMKGKVVSEKAIPSLIEVTKELMEKDNLTINDIDWFIPHQANINIINAVISALNVPKEKVLLNLAKRGNTSSVGVPSCLSENLEAGVVKSGDIVLTCSIGRGFSWGAMLFRYSGEN